MKKAKIILSSLVFTFVFALVLSSAIIFTGCGHKHSFGEWQVVTEATHQTEGLKKRVCEDCGKEQTEVIEKVPHAFSDWTVSVPASCTAEGQETRSCDCGETETRTISKLPHNYKDWEIVTPAECFADGTTQNGLKQRQCHDCTATEKEVIVASHHMAVEEAITPTCTTAGQSERHYCDVCGYEEKAATIIPATGHSYGSFAPNHDVDLSTTHNGTHSKECANCGDIVTEQCSYNTQNVPATCEQNGYNIHTCQTCGDSFEHDQDSFPALGHDYTLVHINDNGHHYHQKVCSHNPEHITERADCAGNVINVESTCYENGYTQTTCDICHEVFRSNPLPLKDHTYGQWTHTEKDGEDYHEHTCTVPECSHTENFHCQNTYTVTPATVCETYTTVTYRCETCQNSYSRQIGSMLEHKYSAWQHKEGTTGEESMHTRECTLCHKTEDQPCEMVEAQKSPATCTADEVVGNSCKHCGYGYDENGEGALGHTFGPWTVETTGEHGRHQHTCTRCYETQYDDCVFTFTLEDPDCTTAGKQTFTCTTEGCTNTYEVIIEPLGHKYIEPGAEEDLNQWEVTETTHSCQCLRPNCGHIETGNHVYNPTNFCAVCGHDGLIYAEEDDYYVVLSDDRVLTAKNIIIPEKHKDLESGKELTVKRIAAGYVNNKRASFLQNHTIETLEFPKTITSIGDYAFDYCIKLRSVTITGSDADDFESALESIGHSAFQSCSSLTEAHFPSSLVSIGSYAFSGCSNLASIIIPDSVTEIGKYAFDGTRYFEMGSHWVNGAFYIGAHLIKVAESTQGAYRVNSETKTISEEAFLGCIYLTKITLPASITEIDADAFLGCTGLQEVVFEGTFSQWVKIIFGNDHASPMNYATKLNISGAVDNITIEDGVTAIPAGTFKNTAIKSISLPESLTTIGEEAFENCEQLTTITFRGESQLSRVMANAFTGSAYYAASTNWENGVLYVGSVVVKVTNEAGETPTLVTEKHSKITGIASKAFEGNTVVKHIIVPTDVVYIGPWAVVGCTSLKTLVFSEANNWFAKSDVGMGRLLKPESLNGSDGGGSAASAMLNLYCNEWIKNYSFSA